MPNEAAVRLSASPSFYLLFFFLGFFPFYIFFLFFFLATQGGFKTALCGSLHEFRQLFVFTGEGKAQVATGSRNVNVLNRVLASQVPFEALFFSFSPLFFFFRMPSFQTAVCLLLSLHLCLHRVSFPLTSPFQEEKKKRRPSLFVISSLHFPCINHTT